MKKSARHNLLETVPVRSEHIRTEWEGACAVGTAVWSLIDGRRNVAEILALLAAHFEGDENYESRVATYLMQLQRDGFIRFLAPLQHRG